MGPARLGLAAAGALALAGCAVSYGEPAAGFSDPAVAAVYIPLHRTLHLVMAGEGAAVEIAPGLAVTNAHNADLVDRKDVIGQSRDYDLLFFRTGRTAEPLAVAEPQSGETVIAYGQGVSRELRVAHGTVTDLDAAVAPRCSGCAPQEAIAFAGDAGPGFSGGPVLDARTGRLLGIVFGYADERGRRVIYAYTMHRIETELSQVEARLPRAPD